MTEERAGTDAGRLLSHGHGRETLERAVQLTRDRIQQLGDRPHVTVARQLELVDQLLEFPLGRFLLQNRGLNGFWTDYIVEHPGHRRMTGGDPEGRPLTTLERILLDEFPTLRATQQRALCFQRLIQENVKDGVVLASVPCGLMRDLLGRDFSDVSDIGLIGIDIDAESLAGAKRLAAFYGIGGNLEFRQADAWDLRLDQRLTLLASNGLNIYECDDDKVTALYRRFFGALAPGGVLMTSFLTPPPVLDPQSEWDLARVDREAWLLERIVFADILNARFNAFRSSATSIAQLASAGFEDLDILWDDRRIFPTVVARRPARAG